MSNRWDQHRKDLTNNVHANYRLQQAYALWGIDALIFDVIEYTAPQHRWDREQFYINTLRPALNIRRDVEQANRGIRGRPIGSTRQAIRSLRKKQLG